ncbi:hypothetical protein [Microbacterium capsulatum]|uniref:Uncharacterized protein n=1 Tax=Microbacterium capsulatum TaxID=3041921 RepID=A0ABU0XJM3_9MICO|nr:hypothetical protein [Microbacterium sp. ASV81]MDQ4215047.1 hypothetical protein [Microbacterium sp. ASV81]
MGMFTQKPEEPTEWAGLPSEPFDRDEATDLPEQPATDPFGLGLGGGGVSIPVVSGAGGSVSIPVPLPEAPETAGAEAGESAGD